MTNAMMHNNQSILIEEFDWDNAVDLISVSEEKKLQEIKDCGKPITTLSRKTGQLRQAPRQCKHYNLCPRCGFWKRKCEFELLSSLTGAARVIKVNKNEEAKITRKYGKENIRRIPVGENESVFVIKTDEDIGEELTIKECEELSHHAIPQYGRRISGKLGTVSSPIKKPVQQQDDDIFVERPVECHYREMDIEYNSFDKDAPANLKELQEIVQEEVEVYETPASEDVLQDAVYMVEEKVKAICERYNMSFNFLVRKKDVLYLSSVDWKWTANKVKIE